MQSTVFNVLKIGKDNGSRRAFPLMIGSLWCGWQFVVESSVEERMQELQERKRQLAAGVLGGPQQSVDEKRQARIDDIKRLIDL